MPTGRRDFLKLTAAVFAPGETSPGVGRVVFCRVSADSLPQAIDWLRSVFHGETPVEVSGATLRYRTFVADYQGRGHELVICGTEATLVADRWGQRRYA